MQDEDVKNEIELVVENNLPKDLAEQKNYISKLGSSYLIVIYIKPLKKEINVAVIETYKNTIIEKLKYNLPNLQVEIIFD